MLHETARAHQATGWRGGGISARGNDMAARGACTTHGNAGDGFLDPRSSPNSFSNQIAGFHRGLKDVGFVENENVAIEYA